MQDTPQQNLPAQTPQQVIDRVFVYGTLKKGFRLHSTIQSAGLVGYSRIRGYMLDTGFRYPALVLAEHGSWIQGEVYNCTEKLLQTLDYIEGVPINYTRVAIYTNNLGPVWVYVWPLERLNGHCKVVPSGIWLGNTTQTCTFYKLLNDNPEFRPPEKPHCVFDPAYQKTIVKQPHYIGADPLVLPSDQNKDKVVYDPSTSSWKAKKEELEEQPIEEKEKIPGISVRWL